MIKIIFLITVYTYNLIAFSFDTGEAFDVIFNKENTKNITPKNIIASFLEKDFKEALNNPKLLNDRIPKGTEITTLIPYRKKYKNTYQILISNTSTFLWEPSNNFKDHIFKIFKQKIFNLNDDLKLNADLELIATYTIPGTQKEAFIFSATTSTCHNCGSLILGTVLEKGETWKSITPLTPITIMGVMGSNFKAQKVLIGPKSIGILITSLFTGQGIVNGVSSLIGITDTWIAEVLNWKSYHDNPGYPPIQDSFGRHSLTLNEWSEILFDEDPLINHRAAYVDDLNNLIPNDCVTNEIPTKNVNLISVDSKQKYSELYNIHMFEIGSAIVDCNSILHYFNHYLYTFDNKKMKYIKTYTYEKNVSPR